MLKKYKGRKSNKKLSKIKIILKRKKFKCTPRNYQFDNSIFFYKRKKFILGDEQGLGKTITSAMCMLLLKNTINILVICPSHLKYNWKDELFDKGRLIGEILQGQKVYKVKSNILIVNYEILQYWLPYLLQVFKPKFVVLDEAQYIKNKKAIRTKAADKLCKKAKYVILATGTPMENGPDDVWKLLNICDPVYFNNFIKFRNRYNIMLRTRYGWQSNGPKNIDELHNILKKYMIRHLKKDVLTELPPKQYSTIRLDVNLKEYSKIQNEFESWLKDNYSTDEAARAKKAVAITKLTRLRQQIGLAKINRVVEFANDFVQHAGNNLILFGYFKNSLRALYKAFNNKNIAYITGETSPFKKAEEVNRFKNDHKCKILIGQIRACGTGLNLTNANMVGIFEPDFNPKKIQQAEDRAHRMGNKHDNIQIVNFVANDSIDIDMYSVLAQKLKAVDAIVDGDKTSWKNIDISSEVLKNFKNRIQKNDKFKKAK